MSTLASEPSDDELRQLESEIDSALKQPPAWENPLEDLYTDAMLNRTKLRKPAKSLDPSLRDALRIAEEKLRQLYTDPANWKRTRGVALIDKSSKTLLGNFSEYLHRTMPNTRKLLREHQPISIEATEEMEGYLGHDLDRRLRGVTWDREAEAIVHVTLDELMVEAPNVRLRACLQLSTIIRVEVLEDTQFACPSGNVLIKLGAGTNIWQAASADTKAAIRKAVL